MQKAYVRSQDHDIEFKLPSDWRIATFAVFEPTVPCGSVIELVTQGLKAPIGAPPLEAQLTSQTTVAILVEDLTRTSPKKEILGVLLERLAAMGIPPEHICIVIALGTHQPLTEDQLADAFGEEVVGQYRFVNHDCHAPDLVTVGRLKSGGAVKINSQVHAADFTIGIGSIFPHPVNGFGGGGKILFPGAANYDAIFEHHLIRSFRDGAQLGNIDGNRFYEEVCEFSTAGRLDFIINSVLDHNDQLYDLVCGDPVAAHQAGMARCKTIISMPFDQLADITIISAFPYTQGPQIAKPLAPAEMVTREGGCIILYAHCTTPIPEIYYAGSARFRRKHAGRVGRAVREHFAANRPLLPQCPPELNMSLAQALLAQDRFNVILVADAIARADVDRLGFFHATDMDQAIAIANGLHPEPSVHIIPSGGVILPVVAAETDSL